LLMRFQIKTLLTTLIDVDNLIDEFNETHPEFKYEEFI
jgi:hypothetical protein